MMSVFEIRSDEAETEVVGAVAQYGTKALDSLMHLQPEHFANAHMAAAFTAAKAIAAAGGQIEIFAIRDWLEANNRGEFAPFELLIDCCQNVAGYSNMPRKEAVIIERANARSAVQMAENFIATVTERRGGSASELIDGFSRSLDGLQTTAVDDEATFDAADLMRIALQEFERRYDSGGKFTGLETGIRLLDEKLFGLQNGGLYVFAGRPGMGKTAVSMSVAEYVADHYQAQGAVLAFNLEMSKEQLAMRSLASVAGVSLSDIQRGNDDGGTNFDKMGAATKRVKERKLLVDVRSNISIGQIRAKARQVKNKHGLNLVVIDYLQLLDEPGKKFANSNDRVGYLSRQCKVLAKELDVPVILLSQLSRAVESRADKRPMLSDLRESGAIEQDADAVVFIYRHGYYTKDQTDNMLELIVAKQRMGESGTAYACFEGQYSRVVDVENAYVDALLSKRNPTKAAGRAM